jgi:hypothetical protein
MPVFALRTCALVAVSLVCLSAPADAAPPPGFITGKVSSTHYNDLATAGLGLAGLQGGAPLVSSPPTATELRTLAIYNNYRALVDPTTGGGFGTFYGPPSVAVPGVNISHSHAGVVPTRTSACWFRSRTVSIRKMPVS